MNYFKSIRFLGGAFVALAVISITLAQPSYEAPPPSREVIQDAGERRAAYLARVNEVYDWRIGRIDADGPPARLDLAVITMLLERNKRIEDCNERVIEMMETPGTGPFWMFPSAIVALAGQDKLSA